jgi:hypothetical protein
MRLPRSFRTLTSVSRHFVFPSIHAFNSSFSSFADFKQPENESHHDNVRRDFDMNGRTMEIIKGNCFIPSASSTPMVNRRMQNASFPFYQRQPPQHTVHYQQQPQLFVMPPPVFKRKTLPQRKKFKPNKKSLEDVSVNSWNFC